MYTSFIRSICCFALLLTVINSYSQDIIVKGGTLTVSTENGGGPGASEGSPKLIDNNLSTKFLINPFVAPLWIQFQCLTPQTAAQYSITSGGDAQGRDPKDWTIQGSNNGTTWTIIDTRTNEVFPGRVQTRTFTIPTLAAYTYYRWNITANSGDGLFQASEWRLLEGLPPSAPTGLTALATSGTQVYLSWVDNAANEGNYEIERSTDGISYNKIQTLDANTVSYLDESDSVNTAYYYRVRATNLYGSSTYSNVVNRTTLGFSGVVTDVTDDGGTLTVSIDNTGGPTAGEGSAKLTDNNIGTKFLINAPIPAAGYYAQYKAINPWIVTRYTITTGNDAATRDPKTWQFLGSNDGTNWTTLDTRTNISMPVRSTPYSFVFANTATFTYYRLLVTVNNGSASIAGQISEWEIWGIDPTAPILPGNLNVTGKTVSSITLKWKDNSNNETGFELQRSTDSIYFASVGTIAANATSYADINLFGGTLYFYRVRALGSLTNSVWSNLVSVETDYDPNLPLTPRNLSVTDISDTSASLQWIDRSLNETGFQIERSTDSVVFTLVGSVAADVNTYIDKTLRLGSRYYYRVRAINGNGNSFYTNVVKAITTGDNQEPTLDAIADKEVCSTVLTYTINLTGITAGPEAWQSTTLAVTSDNDDLFSVLSASPVVDGKSTLTFVGNGTEGGSATVTVTAKDNGGEYNDGTDNFSQEFNVTITPLTIAIASDKGTQINRRDIVTLTASGTATDYKWDTAHGIISTQNSATLMVKPTLNTTYHVTGSNALGCTVQGSIALQFTGGVLVDAVNILTPNGDGKNDKWVIWNIGRYPDNQVKVFDRAGRLVFAAKNYSNDWDGTYQGSPLAEGAYMYVIDLGSGIPGAKGTLTIIRDHK